MMQINNWMVNYRRHLKRLNSSDHTVRNYMNMLKQFVLWLDIPIEQVDNNKILGYMDFLWDRRLGPKTINCHLGNIRGFYNYLYYEQGIKIRNPVKTGYCLKLPKPLPRFLKDDEIERIFEPIKSMRDRAMFKLMLRCGLRVEEVADLTVGLIDLKRQRIIVTGKGSKQRVVYISDDALQALEKYLKLRSSSRVKKVFLVEKGTFKGQPISIRGIQKRMEYYCRKSGLKASCHHLRHTMATQLLNADAPLVTIQDLLGHNWITTTQRYSKVSNLKVQRDYYQAMEVVMSRTVPKDGSQRKKGEKRQPGDGFKP